MAEEWDGRERRKYPRVPLKGEVKGKIHTVSAAPVVDLSVEGALLEVPCVLEPKTLYTCGSPSDRRSNSRSRGK